MSWNNETLGPTAGADTSGDAFEGADWLFGDAGDDRLDGGLGDDSLDGGNGADTLDCSASPGPIRLSGNIGTITNVIN